ncbi:MAG TPA: hypothetical protein VNV16_14990 [Methylibium sp.]|nr:hypothetical protein [Methylibium sp.]
MIEQKRVWVAGRMSEPRWELLGIFENEADAVAACATSVDFVGPVPLNLRLPEEVVAWPECRYPLA